MEKFYGPIGYAETVETVPGVWDDRIIEKNYYGDVLKNVRRYQNSNNVNGNINITNEISIIADPYAFSNFQYMKYILYMGTKWNILSANIQYPRIIITIGDVYNGDTIATS